MNDIKVTIITVAYNCADTIATAIESVLHQTYLNLEYLVVDGLSKDNTAEIARAYIPQFREKGMVMKVISEADKGMYDALNKGIAMATGELVGNINADDWYEPIAVEKIVELYKKENYDLAWAVMTMTANASKLHAPLAVKKSASISIALMMTAR